MKRLIFCISLAATGLMTSCIEKNEEVDADSKPSFLGGSIYEELKNPNPERLTGTFTNYLRLVDDLGEAETLNRTGSRTVFPANDEAFEAFFSNNTWGVHRYEDLTLAQRKLLLNSSTLDNALLLGMLANVSDAGSVTSTDPDDLKKGMALRHPTAASLLDTISIISTGQMPQNNKYWAEHLGKTLYTVSDNTLPMMVHFTRDQLVNNGITTQGAPSDFEVLTGTPYTEGAAYVFDKRVLHSDVACMNGYIHQLDGVLLPPGNMAQVIGTRNELSIFSHVLNYFSVPYPDMTTTQRYNSLAKASGQPEVDTIYQVRYLSARSQGSTAQADAPNITDAHQNVQQYYLNYDPAWNRYFPRSNGGGVNYNEAANMGAMLVPDNQAMKDYFLPGGAGAFLIDIYGSTREGAIVNDEAHLLENLDSLHSQKGELFPSFLDILMRKSFVESAPSKFEDMRNDASENLGMNMSKLRQEDGKYQVDIANNGVVYHLNSMLVPDIYRSVMAPPSLFPDMRVVGWMTDKKDPLSTGYYYYLLAMSANYAFFVPDDEAFTSLYIDPATLGHDRQEAVLFHVVNGVLKAQRYYYDTATNTVGEAKGNDVDVTTSYQWLVNDMLNYHTVVLGDGEKLGTNNFYQTKHGGTICVNGGAAGSQVMGGPQVAGGGMEPATITEVYNEDNGSAYRIDRVIQSPQQSVYKVLEDNADRFSEFFSVCNRFGDTRYMTFAGVSDDTNNALKVSEQDQYLVFDDRFTKITTNSSSGAVTISQIEEACLDMNVRFFNTYNYTLYAPNNDAMQKAYDAGLPRWTDVQALMNKWPDWNKDDHEVSDEEQADRDEARRIVDALFDFVIYHFQSGAVYADNSVTTGRYQTLKTNSLGMAEEVTVGGGSGQLTVTDASGTVHTVSATGALKANLLTRDYWLNTKKDNATDIETTSFCAVHELSEPMCYYTDKSFAHWKEAAARRKAPAVANHHPQQLTK